MIRFWIAFSANPNQPISLQKFFRVGVLGIFHVIFEFCFVTKSAIGILARLCLKSFWIVAALGMNLEW